MKSFISLIVFMVSMATPVLAWNSPAEASRQKEETIYLSLAEAIQKALNNNFEIELARLGKQIGATSLPLQKAIFDPHLKAEGHLIGDRGAPAQPFLGLAKRFPTGTTASLTFVDIKSPTSGIPLPMMPGPVIDSTLELSITQPLLKNRGGIMERGSVKLAQLAFENIDSASLDMIEGAIATTEKAYWDLVFAYNILRIKKDMLKWAEDLVDLNRELIKIGLVERIDLLTSETNLYLRQGELLLTENGFQSAVNRLKFLMNIPAFNNDIVPTEKLAVEDDNEIIPDAKLQEAFVHRRDYQRARTGIQASDIQLKIKATSRLPQVDLIGSTRWQKIDARPGGIFADSPDYFLGVELGFPLGGRKARSEYERALLEKEQALVNLEMIERIIITEVDERVRAVEVNRKRVRQHLHIQELQRLQLEEEMKRFKQGRSRSDVLIRFREALLKTEMATIESLVSYRKSWVDLRQTQNTLLGKWGIKINSQ